MLQLQYQSDPRSIYSLPSESAGGTQRHSVIMVRNCISESWDLAYDLFHCCLIEPYNIFMKLFFLKGFKVTAYLQKLFFLQGFNVTA